MDKRPPAFALLEDSLQPKAKAKDSIAHSGKEYSLEIPIGKKILTLQIDDFNAMSGEFYISENGHRQK